MPNPSVSKHRASQPPSSLRISFKLPLIHHFADLFSSPGLSWLLLTMPYHTSYVSYLVYIEFHSSLLLTLLVFLIFTLLLFTTFHNHGLAAVFLLPLLSFPFKGSTRVKEMQGTLCQSHLTNMLCEKWVTNGGESQWGKQEKQGICWHLQLQLQFLQESSHFKMCSVRSERLNKVWTTNAETALLAIAKDMHVFLSDVCPSHS